MTGNDFAHYFIRHIKMKFLGYNLVLLVFNRDDKKSMTNPTRSKRYEGKTSCAIHILDNTDISKTTKQKIIASTATKSSLTEYWAHKVLSQSWKQTMVVSWNDKLLFTSPTDTWEASVQEEADIKIIFHSLQLLKDSILDIHSPDTDFLVLLIHFFHALPSSTRLMHGMGSSEEPIMIKPIADNLGNEKCQALTALHSISGTDVCGRFYEKGKDSAWSTFQKAGPETVEALAALRLRPYRNHVFSC